MTQSKRITILIITLTLVLGWAIAHTVKSSKQIITFEEAKRVWDGASLEDTGLTYQEVVEIIGTEGTPHQDDTETTRFRENVNSDCFIWENPDNMGWMKADFIEGRLRYVRINTALVPK